MKRLRGNTYILLGSEIGTLDRRSFINRGLILLAHCYLPIGVACARAASPLEEWRKISLTTKRMRELNVAGGDGFQYVHAIAFAPRDPRIVYLSTDQSGVWRSRDGGRSWEPKFKGFYSYGARSIAVDPVNPQIVLAAGFLGMNERDAEQYPLRHQGIYFSSDGGETWRMVYKTEFYKQVSKGALFAFDNAMGKNGTDTKTLHIFCASASDGIIESADGGETWRKTSVDTEVHDIAFSPLRRGVLLFASEKGLFSYNQGVVDKIGLGLPSFPRSIAVSPDRPELVYVAIGQKGVAISSDGGKSFAEPRSFFPARDITDISVSPVDGSRVYIRANKSGSPPLASMDGGKTWHAPKAVDPEGMIGKPGFYFSSPFAPHPVEAKTCLHVTNGRARIIRTEDGGESWHFSGSGFTGARMADMLFLSSERMLLCLTDHGLWETRDGGETFSELGITPIHNARSVSTGAFSGEHMVVGVGSWKLKGLSISHDGGESFSANNDLEEPFDFIAFHPSSKGRVFAGPYASDDYGRNWRRISETVVAMSSDGEILYALKPETGSRTRLVGSRDGGRTFHPLVILDAGPKQIRQVAASPLGTVFVASARGIFRIQDNKVELRDARHGLTKDYFGSLFVECLGFDPREPRVIFAGRRSLGYGNGNGVFMSEDNGETWHDINLNLAPGVTIFAVRVSPFDGTAYIGTSFGTFRLKRNPELGSPGNLNVAPVKK